MESDERTKYDIMDDKRKEQEVESDNKHLLQISRSLKNRFDYKIKEYKTDLTTSQPTKWDHIIMTVTTVLFASGWVLSLPLCMSGLIRINSDVFTAVILAPLFGVSQCLWLTFFFRRCLDHQLSYVPSSGHEWYISFMMGSMNALACILQVFSSVPWRTPPHLQVLLQTCVIPCTVAVKYVILKQGLNLRQAICVCIVLFGLAVSIFPQLFSVDGEVSDSLHPDDYLLHNSTIVSEEHPLSAPGRILWPFVFASSYLPFAVMCVFAEMGMKQHEYHPLTMCMYMQLFSFLMGGLLFWTDILPFFGMADTLAEFNDHQQRAIDCVLLLGGGECSLVTSRMWVYMWTNSASFVSQFFLISKAEGAIYSVLVLALTLPIGSIFWTLFSDNGSLIWDPKFGSQTLFSLSAILLILPPIILYDYFGIGFENEVLDKQ